MVRYTRRPKQDGAQANHDRTHTRLFTFHSLRELFDQTGYQVLEVRGIPAPFPKAVGDNALGRVLVALNRALISICRGLFSYQILVRARALPTVPALLVETIDTSAELKKTGGQAPVGAAVTSGS